MKHQVIIKEYGTNKILKAFKWTDEQREEKVNEEVKTSILIMIVDGSILKKVLLIER